MTQAVSVFIARDWWWEGPDFIVEDGSGERTRLTNAWLSSVHYGLGEQDDSECHITCTRRWGPSATTAAPSAATS